MSKHLPKIIIFGSSGFIGSALHSRFKQFPNCIVSGYNSSTLNLTLPNAKAEIAKLIDSDSIIIIAVNSRHGNTAPASYNENIEIAKNLVGAMSQAQLNKCIYLSSTSVYGDSETDRDIQEQTAPAPSNFYGQSKRETEKLLEDLFSSRGIPLLILRPCMIYGPGDRSNSYGPPRFMNDVLKGNSITLYGDGSERRNYLFIDDLVDIVVRFALGNQKGVYNIASDESHNFIKVVFLLKEIFGRNIQILHAERNRMKADKILNITKLKTELPNFRFTPLADGLHKTVAHLSSCATQH